MSKGKWKSKGDYIGFVGSKAVCVGPIEYVADSLGLGVATAQNYLRRPEGSAVSVRKLPAVYLVEGADSPVTAEKAAELIGCAVKTVPQSRKARRAVREPRALPPAVISQMRRKAVTEGARRRAEARHRDDSGRFDMQAAS